MSSASIPASRSSALFRRLLGGLEGFFSSAVAWAFTIGSVLVLMYLASGLWLGPSSGSVTPLLLAGADAQPPVWGLTYAGKAGLALACAEAVAVLIALVMSVLGAPGPRRLGLLGLLFWSGLWAWGAISLVLGSAPRLMDADPGLSLIALVLVAIFGCVVHRTFRLWSPVRFSL